MGDLEKFGILVIVILVIVIGVVSITPVDREQLPARDMVAQEQVRDQYEVAKLTMQVAPEVQVGDLPEDREIQYYGKLNADTYFVVHGPAMHHGGYDHFRINIGPADHMKPYRIGRFDRCRGDGTEFEVLNYRSAGTVSTFDFPESLVDENGELLLWTFEGKPVWEYVYGASPEKRDRFTRDEWEEIGEIPQRKKK